MTKRTWKAISGTLLALGMSILLLLTIRAAGETEELTTDTFMDFNQGTIDNVDTWSARGSVHLDRRWWPSQMVNAPSPNSKLTPRLSFALTNTAVSTETIFIAVWADERGSDHCPDLYSDRSTNGGRTWGPDVRIMDTCDPDDSPYPECPCMYNPDTAMRAADESLWVVWWQDWTDSREPGDIYYTTSSDKGQSWSSSRTAVYTGTGKQLWPRIASHASSGYLYTAWEDERDDDGDIYISRYHPDTDTAWETPIKISDDTADAQQRQPALAVDVDGNLYTAWEDFRDDLDGYDEQVYFSRWITGTGWTETAWMTNTRLSDPDAHFAGDPYIIAGPGGILYAAWYERMPTDAGGGYTFRVVAARSDDQGDTWTRSVVAQLPESFESGLSSYGTPAIGIDWSDRLYVAWGWLLDSTSGNSRLVFAQSPDGGLHWTAYRMLTDVEQWVDALDLVSSFDGEVVATWEQYVGASPQIHATGYPADNYLSSGTYARTLDPGGLASWDTITWTAAISPNTSLRVATRVMTSAGAGWTDWVTHAASGEALSHPDGRYIQYRAAFTSTTPPPTNDTPVLHEVTVSYQPYHQVYLPLVLKEG